MEISTAIKNKVVSPSRCGECFFSFPLKQKCLWALRVNRNWSHEAAKFVLLSFFTLIETICRYFGTKPLPKNAKRPLPVDARCSKTSYYLVQTPVCCSISGYPQKPHWLRAVCYCGLCVAGIYTVTLSALQYNCKYYNIFFFESSYLKFRFLESILFFSSRNRILLRLMLNLSTMATLGIEEMAFLERWLLWGGRGVKWHLSFFLGVQHVYCVKFMLTVSRC